MQIWEMKRDLKKLYNNNERWCRRVDSMHDNQVVAVYYSDSIKQKRKEKERKKDEQIQLLFD